MIGEVDSQELEKKKEGGEDETTKGTEEGVQPPLLSIDVTGPVINATTGTATPTAPTDGLTPLGAGLPQTPILMKQRSSSTALEQQQQEVENSPTTLGINNSTTAAAAVTAASSSASAGQLFIEAMVAEGTPLVLEEESEGRLQQRHPWIYAAAEDLNIVRTYTLSFLGFLFL